MASRANSNWSVEKVYLETGGARLALVTRKFPYAWITLPGHKNRKRVLLSSLHSEAVTPSDAERFLASLERKP